MTIQELQSKLNHSDMEVRAKTLQSLLKMGNHEAYGLLMYVAGNHFSPETRREAKKASLILQKTLFAAKPENQEIAEPNDPSLIDRLKSGDLEEKIKILRDLENSDNQKYFDSLINLLHQEQNPEVLPSLIWTCASLGKINSVPHITNFLRSGNPKVRASVIRSLASIEDSKNYPLLVRFTRDTDEGVRNESLKAVANLPADPLLDCLSQMAKKNSDFHRDAVIFVIARLAFEPGFKLIKSLVKSESDIVQKRASMALEYLIKKGILDAESTPSDSAEVTTPKVHSSASKKSRVNSVSTLDDELDENSAPKQTADLEEQLGSSDSQLDQEENNHIRVIRQGEEASAIKSIFALIENNRLNRLDELKESINERNSKRLLATFIMALAQSKDKNHKDFLKQCLKHTDGRVQANAIEALRMLGCVEVKTELLPFLTESNHDRARANAIIFLHPTGLINTTQELQNMLSSKNDNRKLSAIFAIMDLFDPKLIPLLESPIDSPNPKVTRRAIDALKLFVLDKQDTAIKMAEEWKIMEEMTSEDSKENQDNNADSNIEDQQENMDELMSDLNEGKTNNSKVTTSEEDGPESSTDSENKNGFFKLKSLMKKFLKK